MLVTLCIPHLNDITASCTKAATLTDSLPVGKGRGQKEVTYGKRTCDVKESGTTVPSMSSTTAVGCLEGASLRFFAAGPLSVAPLAAPIDTKRLNLLAAFSIFMFDEQASGLVEISKSDSNLVYVTVHGCLDATA